MIVKNSIDVPAGVSTAIGANCPQGTYATGGGYSNSDSLTNYVYAQYPQAFDFVHPDSWYVLLQNTSGATVTFSAYAVCTS